MFIGLISGIISGIIVSIVIEIIKNIKEQKYIINIKTRLLTKIKISLNDFRKFEDYLVDVHEILLNKRKLENNAKTIINVRNELFEYLTDEEYETLSALSTSIDRIINMKDKMISTYNKNDKQILIDMYALIGKCRNNKPISGILIEEQSPYEIPAKNYIAKNKIKNKEKIIKIQNINSFILYYEMLLMFISSFDIDFNYIKIDSFGLIDSISLNDYN